ncbi:phosphoribosylglycinamide formyltransferase [Porphyromonas macacae]|uniref:Phosphoribosylglycinamide formyltransferase n=1 Tax=Porphyromonas macacae TaxID=28115 RepID=A0A379DGL9_9PORP|nr:phosphoribosylglycinamide formyltransferase [Porphyromonas macacae]SUB77282.1 Phosphoribosylglycinamide formyltransferase [Porphyromonas macacae]
MVNIAIFASGSGTNAENIHDFFSKHSLNTQIKLIICNTPDAGVLQRAGRLGIESATFTNQEMKNGSLPIELLKKHHIDLIVLAGYMNLIAQPLLDAYPKRILNIHPALLPAYGGKGMYGHHVHEAVIAHKETRSGITIHIVDEHYDHGTTLCQATCPVFPEDTADTLAERIHSLEYRYYPVTILQYIRELGLETQ